MFRVLVEKELAEGSFIKGLFAGAKDGEGANVYIVSVADYDVSPENFAEYPRIETANERADWCRSKGWKATVIDELGNAAA